MTDDEWSAFLAEHFTPAEDSQPIVITSNITLTVDGQTVSRAIRRRRDPEDDEDGTTPPDGRQE